MPLPLEVTARTVVHTLRIQPLVGIDLVGEGVAQGQGREEHLHADDEILVAGSHGALAH